MEKLLVMNLMSVKNFQKINDFLTFDLTKCAITYRLKIYFPSLVIFFPVLKNKCEHLANAYADLNECKHFDHCLTLDKNFAIFPLLYRKLISDNLNSMIPNIKISLIITVLDSDRL